MLQKTNTREIRASTGACPAVLSKMLWLQSYEALYALIRTAVCTHFTECVYYYSHYNYNTLYIMNDTSTSSKTSLPHWDLTPLYPSLDSDEFKSDIEWLRQQLKELTQFMDDNDISAEAELPAPDIAGKRLGEMVEKSNDVFTRMGKVHAFVGGFVSTDSFNTKARKIASELDIMGIEFQRLEIRFDSWLRLFSQEEGAIEAAIDANETAQKYRFFITEATDQSRYMMSPEEENLTAELSLSGGRAFAKLYGTVTSQLTATFEVDGEEKELPVTQIRNYCSSPDETVRKRAYQTEIAAWDTVAEPLAACMNGVKGHTITVSKRRGREDELHQSLDQARISRETLSTLLSVMKESFPVFRKYWKSKATRLGKEQIAWWDIRAPLGADTKQFTYDEARDFIVEQFGTFSDELAAFAANAFDKNWIDAEPRKGKRGGAFCMPIHAIEQSRILCNFDGSFNLVATLAHELGHGFHNYCHRGQKLLNTRTPMTLAETASIFCETIVTNAALKQIESPEQELAVMESILISASQVIVDIYSRFIFEKNVFERRAKSELSVDDLNTLMLDAQAETYGDALDEKYRNKYMWTWKPHYYSPGLAYYNYPYAFGLLFGLGLYAIYEERGDAFVPEYTQLLASTGNARPAELAKRFNIDITQPEFWQKSIDIIAQRVERYCNL